MEQYVVHPIERTPTSDSVPMDLFGASYTGFRPFSGFQDQADELEVSQVRWPGGTLSELQESVYSLSNPEIFDGRFLYDYKESRDRPGLTDMFEYCVDESLSFTIIVPTARYADDIPSGRDDVERLVTSIASGTFGEIPSELIFEIGNEYYGIEPFESDPRKYGEVSNELIESLSAAISLEAAAFSAVDIGIAIQMGRTSVDDKAIRDAFSPLSLREIDALSVHSLPISLKNFHGTEKTGDPEDAGKSRIERAVGYYADWTATVSSILGESKELDLYVSAWSVGGAATNVGEVDLDFRDYGLKAAPTAVDMIWNFAIIGVDMASAWGVGNRNKNWFSYKENGQDEYSPLGEIFGMMSEALPGMQPLDLGKPYKGTEEFLVHGFQDSDTLVFYISAQELENDAGVFRLDMSNLSYLGELSARQLNATSRSLEPVQGVETLPILTTYEPIADGNSISLEFTQDYQVIELTFDMPKGVNWNYGESLSQAVASAIERVIGSLSVLSEDSTRNLLAAAHLEQMDLPKRDSEVEVLDGNEKVPPAEVTATSSLDLGDVLFSDDFLF